MTFTQGGKRSLQSLPSAREVVIETDYVTLKMLGGLARGASVGDCGDLQKLFLATETDRMPVLFASYFFLLATICTKRPPLTTKSASSFLSGENQDVCSQLSYQQVPFFFSL